VKQLASPQECLANIQHLHFLVERYGKWQRPAWGLHIPADTDRRLDQRQTCKQPVNKKKFSDVWPQYATSLLVLTQKHLKFETVTIISTRMKVFCDMTQCSLLLGHYFIWQLGLKFKEETSKMLHLERSFVWCWNSET